MNESRIPTLHYLLNIVFRNIKNINNSYSKYISNRGHYIITSSIFFLLFAASDPYKLHFLEGIEHYFRLLSQNTGLSEWLYLKTNMKFRHFKSIQNDTNCSMETFYQLYLGSEIHAHQLGATKMNFLGLSFGGTLFRLCSCPGPCTSGTYVQLVLSIDKSNWIPAIYRMVGSFNRQEQSDPCYL